MNEALQARSEFRRTAACKARLFFPRFLLARQKKSGRRRAISGLSKQTHNKNKNHSYPRNPHKRQSQKTPAKHPPNKKPADHQASRLCKQLFRSWSDGAAYPSLY
ncbi:hypothetical protein [Comamonas aquatica]|uniref:hypothetical protein n=1 Tax=Comamonas aquatica TaxID=225991 RepID=UPI001F3FF4AB|nr:hypothetical protein [Comamonas aquatica]